MAIDTFQQVLLACLEYRNLAIDKGATAEELETALFYFDKEEFGDTINMALKDLNYLYLNSIAEASFQPQPKEPVKKPEVPKVEIKTERSIGYYLMPQGHVSMSVKEDFIHRFIEKGEYFPIDSTKEFISKMDYADFLKTPYWKSIALYIKERDGKKCSICGATKALAAHHLTYENHGDELHHLEDLACVCNKCHEGFHNQK